MNLQDFSDKIQEIAQLQKKIRKVYLTTQNAELRNSRYTYVQPFLEMRYVFEHFSDALLDADGGWNTDTTLTIKELEKVHSHLVRCYTDILEWRFLSIKTHMYKMTKMLSSDDIKTAIPNYYTEIKPKFNETQKNIIDVKMHAEAKDNAQARVELLDKVSKSCEELFAAINEDALIELRIKARRRFLQATAFDIFKILFAAAVGLLIGIFITI